MQGAQGCSDTEHASHILASVIFLIWAVRTSFKFDEQSRSGHAGKNIKTCVTPLPVAEASQYSVPSTALLGSTMLQGRCEMNIQRGEGAHTRNNQGEWLKLSQPLMRA